MAVPVCPYRFPHFNRNKKRSSVYSVNAYASKHTCWIVPEFSIYAIKSLKDNLFQNFDVGLPQGLLPIYCCMINLKTRLLNIRWISSSTWGFFDKLEFSQALWIRGTDENVQLVSVKRITLIMHLFTVNTEVSFSIPAAVLQDKWSMQSDKLRGVAKFWSTWGDILNARDFWAQDVCQQ